MQFDQSLFVNMKNIYVLGYLKCFPDFETLLICIFVLVCYIYKQKCLYLHMENSFFFLHCLSSFTYYFPFFQWLNRLKLWNEGEVDCDREMFPSGWTFRCYAQLLICAFVLFFLTYIVKSATDRCTFVLSFSFNKNELNPGLQKINMHLLTYKLKSTM